MAEAGSCQAETLADRMAARTAPSVESLAREMGLKLGDQNELTIRRIKRGKSYSFVRANGSHVRDARTIRRLHSMAVPPAYAEVRYSPDPNSQPAGGWPRCRGPAAVPLSLRLGEGQGTPQGPSPGAAGGGAAEDPPQRLDAPVGRVAHPRIRALGGDRIDRAYSDWPGNKSYARLNGTRGATTLLKSNVTLEDDCVVLTFKAKGGKAVRKECDAAKLVRAIGILRNVPGKRMFQYRDNSGNVRSVSTTTVNAFLREIAGIKISLKDFRTLMASAVVVESLSRISPAASARGRRKQVLEAVRAAADELSNTPAICRKSYVHDTIVTAFEDGILERFAATMKGYRSQSKREALLAQVVMAAAAA